MINKLEATSFPAMFILGENDEAIKAEHIHELSSLVKNSKVKIIKECGHGPHLISEKPTLLNNIILEFLKEIN
jgi:pimeloyl-ACP methyl ester carboxylesterase